MFKDQELPKDPPVQDPPPPEPTPEEKAKAAKARKYKYADYVSLTRDEYSKLVEQYSEEDAKDMITLLDNYKGQTGKRYKSDYRAILNWVVSAYFERKSKGIYDNKRQKNNTAAGYGNNQSIPGGEASATQPGKVQESSDDAQKDYSERFI